MARRSRKSRGYSLPEVLTVAAIIGLIALVGIPALATLMPQYRVRSAASEVAATIRMARESAVATRRPWRVSFDAANARYAISELSTPGADIKTPGNWTKIGENNRVVPAGGVWWKTLPDNVTLSTVNFLDVDCANGTDLIFQRDGTVDTTFNTACTAGGSAALAFPASVRLHYDSRFVPTNTYYLDTPTAAGFLTPRQTKE